MRGPPEYIWTVVYRILVRIDEPSSDDETGFERSICPRRLDGRLRNNVHSFQVVAARDITPLLWISGIDFLRRLL
jgi:hypothetical protein